ncbi:reverse transcriptase domain-containing protein [Tanacetum coccineum]
MVQNRIFRGGNDEEPHAHIRHFESITNNQRYPDVPNTTIKLLLFPFSLDGVAKTWLEKEPPNSILTWDDLVSKFITSLSSHLSENTNLRNEITNFRQIAQESFSEAWERFKELLRKCPHHGFSLMHQLDTFYNSLSYNDQDSLNSAAGGNFLYKSPNEGLLIIENKAKVRCSRNGVSRCKYPISCSCLSGETWTSLKPNKVERILLPSRFCEFYDFVADPRVPLLLGSQDNEFNPYVDAYETSSKDVCEPEYNEKAFLMRASRIISPKIDVKPLCTSFAPKWNFARKWATSEFVKDNVEVNHEVFKNDSENSLGIHDDKEEEIAFLDSLLEDENFFEMNDKKVFRIWKSFHGSYLWRGQAIPAISLMVFHLLFINMVRIEKTKRSKNDQKPTRNKKKTKSQEQDKEISQKSQPDQPDTVKLSQRKK